MGAHTWLGCALPGFATVTKANLTVLSELRTIDREAWKESTHL
jgi:hypothetical protein